MPNKIVSWGQSLIDSTLSKIANIFPIKEDYLEVRLLKLYPIDAGKYAYNYDSQKESVINKTDFSSPIKADIEIVNTNTHKTLKKGTVVLMDMPLLTSRGTFIIDGNDYTIKHQLRRKPGIYSRIAENGELETEILVKGGMYKLKLDPKTGIFYIFIQNKKRPLFSFLKGLGVTDAEISKTWGRKLYNINKDLYKEKHIEDFKQMLKMDDLRIGLSQMEVNYEVTRNTLGAYNKNRGFKFLTPEVFLAASKKLLNISKEKDVPDERDALKFKKFTSANTIFNQYITNTADIIKEGISKNLKSILRGKKNINDTLDDLINTGHANYSLRKFFNLDLTNVTENANPLSIISSPDKVTFLGKGAIDDERKVPIETRNIHPTHIGILDPVHTPAAKAGVTLNLATNAKVKIGSQALSTEIILKDGTKKYISTEDLYDMKIAFPDQYTEKGKPKYDVARVVYRGKILEVPYKEVDGRYANASGMFSITTSLVPFLNNNSGNRVQMASQMLEQAISLKHREVPMVDTKIKGKSASQYIAEQFSTTSPVNGVITNVDKNSITIKSNSGKMRKLSLYTNYPIAGDKYITEKPIVSVGDQVKEGQILTENNYTKDGKLALGTNLLTAYIPGDGWTFEDGFVVSEQGAKKLTSQHLYKFEIEIEPDVMVFSKSSYISQVPGKLNTEQLNKLDDKGIVTKGSILSKDDPIIVYLKKTTADALGKIHKTFKNLYIPKQIMWSKDYPGKVVEVHTTPTHIIVMVRADAPAQIGDKIAGRYGNKGVIARIIPDASAPKTKDGEIIDVILPPEAVPTRMNPGQLLEVALTKVLKKRGIKTMPIEAFSLKDTDKQIKDMMDKEGVKAKEDLIDPEFGTIKDINMGYQYWLKLEQQSDKKMTVRNTGSYDFDEQPIGNKGGAQSLNRLLFGSLLAHNARENLREMGTLKGQKNDDYWRAVRMGMPIPSPKGTPFALTKFYDLLRGVGINPKDEGDTVKLLPDTKQNILRRSNGEITSGKILRGKDGSPIADGLFDQKITGGLDGDKWAHIRLAKEMPNPIFENAIKSILDLTTSKYNDVIRNKYFYDPATQSWTDTKREGVIVGPQALKKALKDIDINKELDKQLELSGTVNNVTQLNKISKKSKYLKLLKDNDWSTDIYFSDVVPVVPPKLRPISEQRGSLIQSPLNKLYSNLIVYNSKYKDIKYKTKNLDGRVNSSIYSHLKKLYGLEDAEISGREYEGILKGIAGPNPKRGYFNKKVIKKRQDISGRAVISLDTHLKPDEIGLPEKMAWKLYEPFIMRSLVKNGFSPLQAKDKIKNKDSVAKHYLDLEVNKRPLLVNRDPSLHKYSIMAVKPIVKPGLKSIQMNPFIIEGMGADFDGDTVALHVPIGESAIKEAYGMMAVHHIKNPGTLKYTLSPKGDALLGLNFLTTEGSKTNKTYTTPEEALKGFNENKLDPSDIIHVNGEKTTYGRLLIKSVLPDIKLPEGPITKKNITSVLDSINSKNPEDYNLNVSKLTGLGNRFSYTKGFTISIDDLISTNEKAKKERDRIFKKTLDKIRKIDKKYKGKPYTAQENELRSEILFGGMEDMQNALDKVYDETNSFIKMRNVGSKGKDSQVVQNIMAPLAFMDVLGRPIKYPIGKSYGEGLPVSDYIMALFGTRKGMIDSRLEVSEPGFLAKQFMNTAQGNVISMKDCGTTRGTQLSIDDSNCLDRFLAHDQHVYPRNTLITDEVIQNLKKKKVTKIIVRSPLYCEASEGTCQYCAGLTEQGELYKIGSNLGALAATTLSEPLTQATLSSKHTSGTKGNADVGFPRVRQLAMMPKILPNSAVLSETDGKISDIYPGPAGGHFIKIKQSKTGKIIEQFAPQGSSFIKKINDPVVTGEKITSGNMNPVDFYEYTKDIDKTREVITNELDTAYQGIGTKMRRIIFESFVKPMTDYVRIHKSHTKEVLPGTYTTLSKAKKLKDKHGDKIEYESVIKGVNTLPSLSDDWAARLSFAKLKDTIITGAASGIETNKHSYNPMGAWIHAKEFGKGTYGRY